MYPLSKCVCVCGVIVRSHTLWVESVTLRWEWTVGGAKVPSTSQTNMLRKSVNLRHLQKKSQEKSLTIWTSSGTRQENCELHLSRTHTHTLRGEITHSLYVWLGPERPGKWHISLSWVSAFISVWGGECVSH